MTRDKLVEIMSENLSAGGMDICDCEISGFADAAEHILLALNQERVGEVVLATGEIAPAFDSYDEHIGEYVGDVFIEGISEKLEGKRGVLIFREQEGK